MRNRTHSLRMVGGALMVVVGTSVSLADLGQNMAVFGLPAHLLNAGAGNLNGTGVTVGQLEGGIANMFWTPAPTGVPGDIYLGNSGILSTGAPTGRTNSLMPNGNPLLPGNQFWIQANAPFSNHASQVAGAMMNNHAVHGGLSQGITINSGFFASAVPVATPEPRQADLMRSSIIASQNMMWGFQNPPAPGDAGPPAQGPSATIFNHSYGFRRPALNAGAAGNNTPVNNGDSLFSRFIDWSSQRPTGTPPSSPTYRLLNVLHVVAGNEGTANGNLDFGSPSDAFNVLNVGATGRIDGSGNLVYDRLAAYNLSNRTSDGRVGVHLVAPGGNPVAANGPFGTFNAPPAPKSPAAGVNNAATGQNGYYPTVGGIIQRAVTNTGQSFWDFEDLDGDGLGNDAYFAFDNTHGDVPLTNNPNPRPRTTDAIIAHSSAGTSFAAPLVTSAGAMLTQLGRSRNYSTDSVLLRALLMNGATKKSPSGTDLLRPEGYGYELEGNPGQIFQRNGNFNNMIPWEARGLAGVFDQKPDPFAPPGTVPFTTPFVGLDPYLGTGQLHVARSASNYLGGQQGPGDVTPRGWDQRSIDSLQTFSYVLNNVGGEFAATLTWDRRSYLDHADASGGWVPGANFHNYATIDLDLYLFRIGPNGDEYVAESSSFVDNVEHIWLADLAAGNYRIEVRNLTTSVNDFGGMTRDYALAWFVPSPGTGALLLVLGMVSVRRRRAPRPHDTSAESGCD